MKKLLIGAVALAGIVMSLPANAQNVYFGFGGGPRYERPYGYYDGYRPYRRHYYNSYAGDYGSCRVVRVWAGDHYRRIRRCF
ncbi:MAG TPA: hypothetical protein VK522_06925 [Pseudolabrys sp.]|jgi:hypothetical protein|nr:hypothetical protein [Pseudolabrys sp.]